MFGRRRVPRWPGYPGQRGHRVSPGIEGWPETRPPWYLCPLTWDWGGTLQGVGIGLAASLVLFFAGLGVHRAWQVAHPPAPCTVTYSFSHGVSFPAITPAGCALVVPGSFSP